MGSLCRVAAYLNICFHRDGKKPPRVKLALVIFKFEYINEITDFSNY